MGVGGKPSLGCLPPSCGESGTSKPSFLLTSVSLSVWPLYCPREREGGLKSQLVLETVAFQSARN